VALARPLVPPPVHLGENTGRGVEPADCPRACGRHVDVEDPGESGLVGEELQEPPARGPEQVLVVGPGRERAARGCHAGDHQFPALAGRGQEALLLVREVRVERLLGHPGAAHDVGDRDGLVAGSETAAITDRSSRSRCEALTAGGGRWLRPRGSPG
jgi:hypothetical protein